MLAEAEAPVITKEKKKLMHFRFAPSDVTLWQELADKGKISLSEWIRQRCNGHTSTLTAAAERRGMDAEWLADRIKTIVEDSETLPRDALTAIKTLVAARGEETGVAHTPSTSILNLKTPKALIIMGTDPASVAKMIGKGA